MIAIPPQKSRPGSRVTGGMKIETREGLPPACAEHHLFYLGRCCVLLFCLSGLVLVVGRPALCVFFLFSSYVLPG
jgi:hypothetical protein